MEPVIHTLLTLPPFDLVRARHVRDQTTLTHTWYTFDARADRCARGLGPWHTRAKPNLDSPNTVGSAILRLCFTCIYPQTKTSMQRKKAVCFVEAVALPTVGAR